MPKPSRPHRIATLAAGALAIAATLLATVLSGAGPASAAGTDVLVTFPASGSGAISAVGISGYYAPDDNRQHVIVATVDGNIHEVWFSPAQGVHSDVLTNIPDATGIAAYYSPDDNDQHVMVATSDGIIFEVWFAPGQGVHTRALVDLPPATNGTIEKIAAYYSPGNGFQHVIATMSGGQVMDIYTAPGQSVYTRTLATVPGAVQVAAYGTPDGVDHVFVASYDTDAKVTELVVRRRRGVTPQVVLEGPMPFNIAAYYAPTDSTQHLLYFAGGYSALNDLVRALDGTGGTVFTPSRQLGWFTGYYAGDDEAQHVMVAQPDGLVYENYFYDHNDEPR